jgi:peptidoglycan hydrolase-like protein with peptidoglycan-binding domain
VRSDGELEKDVGDVRPYLPAHATSSADRSTDKQSADTPQIITKKLVSGVRDPQVKRLQELLNKLGYRLSVSGPGSPGEETNFFGAKTRAAVKEFQCDNNIVCSGSRYTTGYGLVGEKTRNKLNKQASELSEYSRRTPGGVLIRADDDRTTKDQDDSKTNSDQKTDSTPINTELARKLDEITDRIKQLQTQLSR